MFGTPVNFMDSVEKNISLILVHNMVIVSLVETSVVIKTGQKIVCKTCFVFGQTSFIRIIISDLA